jgi:hypothetical protein
MSSNSAGISLLSVAAMIVSAKLVFFSRTASLLLLMVVSSLVTGSSLSSISRTIVLATAFLFDLTP